MSTDRDLMADLRAADPLLHRGVDASPARMASIHRVVTGWQHQRPLDRGPRRRRRGWITATAGVAVVILGAGTAAAWVNRVEPSVRDATRCFAIATTDFGDLGKSGEAFFDLTYITMDSGTGEIIERAMTPERAVEVCADSWRIGRIASTKPYLRDLNPWYLDSKGPEPASSPVPDLVACVLPTGQAGVFPNTDCATLGLQEADLN